MTSQLLLEINRTLKIAVDADEKDNDVERAYEHYKKALEQYSRYKKELEKKFQPHFERVQKIAKILNRGSSITDIVQDRFYPTDSSPKLSHVVKLSDVKLNAVGGLENCKQVLKEAAIWPKKYPHFFTGKFLLHHCI